MINFGKTVLVVGCAVVGGAAAASSGFGLPMIAACALAGAGAPSVLKTTAKIAAKVTGRKVALDSDDAVTLGLATAGVALVATLAPKDIKEDPMSYPVAASGLTGAGIALKGIVDTCVTTRQAAADAGEQVRRMRNF